MIGKDSAYRRVKQMNELTTKTKFAAALIVASILGLIFWWWYASCGDCDISFDVPKGPLTETVEMCHPAAPTTTAALLHYCSEKYPCDSRKCTVPGKQCQTSRFGEAPGNITANCTSIGVCPTEGLPLTKYRCTITVPANEFLNCGCECF